MKSIINIFQPDKLVITEILHLLKLFSFLYIVPITFNSNKFILTAQVLNDQGYILADDFPKDGDVLENPRPIGSFHYHRG